jgi:hypothetical protein
MPGRRGNERRHGATGGGGPAGQGLQAPLIHSYCSQPKRGSRPINASAFRFTWCAPRRNLTNPEGGIPSPARPSQPPGIESCVVQGNDHDEAWTERQAGRNASEAMEPRHNRTAEADRVLGREGTSKRGLRTTALETLPGSESTACLEMEGCRDSGSPWRSHASE